MRKSGLMIAGLVLCATQAGAQVIVSCDAEHNVAEQRCGGTRCGPHKHGGP